MSAPQDDSASQDSHSSTESRPKSFLDLLKALRSKRMMTVLLLGFSSGLPLMLLASNLKLWLRREGIDLSTIGYFTLVMVPYTFNYVWAPLLDRFIPSKRLGRRRSWILITQLGLMVSLAGLALGNPQGSVEKIALIAIAVAFWSATQDIAIDAYRREILPDDEQGIGASFAVYGYRVGMFVATGFGLWIVDPDTVGLSYNQMFLVMSALMLIGVGTTLWAKEPEAVFAPPRTFYETVIEPFFEFLKRRGAITILLFVLFYKLGDAFAGAMASPFYADLGFSDGEIATAAKTVGLFSTFIGLFLGGVLIFRLGILRALLLFALLQAISTSLFAALSTIGPNWWALAGVVAFEDVSSGMGTAALVAFMSVLANRKFTATQYALLSSLAVSGRTALSSFSGQVAESFGYTFLFLFGSALALPAILLLLRLKSMFGDQLPEPQPPGAEPSASADSAA